MQIWERQRVWARRESRPPGFAGFGAWLRANEGAPAGLPGFRSSFDRRAAIYDASIVQRPVFVNHKMYSSIRFADGGKNREELNNQVTRDQSRMLTADDADGRGFGGEGGDLSGEWKSG